MRCCAGEYALSRSHFEKWRELVNAANLLDEKAVLKDETWFLGESGAA